MPLPDVTVIIPVYNSAATLPRAIASVLAQTLASFELLVVDDGSTDQTLMVAQREAARDGRVTVIALPQNGGKARAMNHASGRANGRWIAVLDADDQFLPTRLEQAVRAGDAFEADFVADNQLHIDNATGRVVRSAFIAAGAGREVGLADFIAHSNPGAPFDFGILKPIVRAEFLRGSGVAYYPDAKLAEDYYFLLELLAAGARGYLLHTALYEWTLPFSPSARRWTDTGSGAWRYDYRNALETNRVFQSRQSVASRPDLLRLLRRREREYNTMVHYLDAQRVLADHGSHARALAIIAGHPRTWTLLARRLGGRLARAATQRRAGAV